MEGKVVCARSQTVATQTHGKTDAEIDAFLTRTLNRGKYADSCSSSLKSTENISYIRCMGDWSSVVGIKKIRTVLHYTEPYRHCCVAQHAVRSLHEQPQLPPF